MKIALINYTFLGIVFFVRCSSLKVPAVYISKNGRYKISLNSDSTFFFQYKFQFAYKYSDGFFSTIKSRDVSLRSSIKDRKLPIDVKVLNNPQSFDKNFLKFLFFFSGKESMFYKCQLSIDGVVFKNTYCDSLYALTVDEPINSFSVAISADERKPSRFLDTLYSDIYKTMTSSKNNLAVEILVNDSLFNYKIFDNKIIKVSNKKLVMIDEGKKVILFRLKRE